jgi:hypothetical protein
MELHLSDPSYTDRLVSFLRSVGQTANVTGPGLVEVKVVPEAGDLVELDIYLGVWEVLYPGTEVQLGASAGAAGAVDGAA